MNTATRTLPKEERPLSALISDLSHETTDLMHQEMALAKAEISDKISQLGAGAAALVLGGVVLFAGFLKVLNAISAWLIQVLPPQWDWLAPLAVGLVVAIVGVIALQRGRSKLRTVDLTPRRTVESLTRDKEFVKEQAQ